MELKLYAIKDTKVAFKNPWTHHNDVTAVREIKAGIKDQPIEIIQDWELWRVGSYDDKTGIIVPDLHHVANLIDLRGDKNE